MFRRIGRLVLVAACGLGLARPSAAQSSPVTQFPSAAGTRLPVFAPGLVPDFGASPFDALTSLTGGPALDGDEIETDRDSFTPAPGTAGRGRVIVESAYTYTDNRQVM